MPSQVLKRAIQLIIAIFCLVYLMKTCFFASRGKMSQVESSFGLRDQWLVERENVMEERRQKLAEVCSSWGSNVHWTKAPNSEFFLVDYGNKLAYCRVPKVASTTLLRYFVELSFLPEQVKERWRLKPHQTISNLYDMEYDHTMTVKGLVEHLEEEHMFTFIFVRHPFERLVSAFEDKILNNDQPRKYQALIQKVGGSFSKFVDHVLENAKGKKCDLMKGSCNLDEHVRPFYSWCAVCDIPFDAIGKTETFNEDLKYILKVNRLDSQIDVDKLSIKMHSSNNVQDKAKNYFSHLNAHQRRELIKLYQFDLELFSYSADPYF